MSRGDDLEGAELMIQAHGVMEVWEGGFGTRWQSVSPFDEEADGEPAEHGEHPKGIAMAHAAFVFIGADIEALMEAALDAPALAIEVKPFLGVEALDRRAGEQMHRFWLAMADLAAQDRRLRRRGKTDRFGGHFTGFDGAPFVAAFVFLMRLSPNHRRVSRLAGPRGERPPVAAATGFEAWFARPVGCL